MSSKRLYKITTVTEPQREYFQSKPQTSTHFSELTEEDMLKNVAYYKTNGLTITVTVHEYLISGIRLITDMEKRWCGV